MIQDVHKHKGGVIVYILPDNALEHITFVIREHKNANFDDE
jgi:hypothetical protein